MKPTTLDQPTATVLEGERLSPRIKRLSDRLQDSMQRAQQTWRPAPIAQDPALAGLPLVLRRAWAFARVLDEMPIEIAEDEWIVGKTARGGVILRTALPEFVSPAEKEQAKAEGRGIPMGLSHKVPDYPSVVERGLSAMLADIRDRISVVQARPDSGEKTETQHWLQAMGIEIEAVLRLALRYADLAEVQAASSAPERARELRRIAEVCRSVPAGPAQSFHAVLQSVWFVHYAFYSTGTNLSLGRFDQYCGPLLERDLAEKRVTLAQAQEMVDCLWIKFNDRAQINPENFSNRAVDRPWQAGLRWRTLVGSDNADAVNHFGQNLLLSGIRPDGRDGTNTLTYLMLDSLETFALTSPVVTVRLHRASPPELLRRCAEVLQKGGGMPYIDNDDVIVPAYQKLGVPIEDAREYANSNCWETMIAGKSDQELIRGYNFLLILEWALNRGVSRVSGAQEGIDTGDPRRFASFDQLMAAWKRQLDVYLEKTIDYFGAHLTSGDLAHSNHGRTAYNPLLSALVQDCLSREKDIIRGGARYAIWHVMGEAVANAIDALAALKKLVYDERKVSLEDVLAALANNWDGYENLRQSNGQPRPQVCQR